MPAAPSQPDLVATTLLREIGSELNRILELPDRASRVRDLMIGAEGPDYEGLAQPFRDSGIAYVRKNRSLVWIEERITNLGLHLIANYGPSWERTTGDGEQLTALLARPQTEALWAAQKEIAHRTNQPPANNANLWQGLRIKFQALRKEELKVDPRNKLDHWLRASSISLMEWQLSKGISENFHKRLELLATSAGAALGPAPGTTKMNHWLYRLYLELKGDRSRLLFAPSGGSWTRSKNGELTPREVEGGIILSVSEASAMYCADLAREAIEGSAVTKGNTKSRPRAARSEEPNFKMNESGQKIEFKGREYNLTPLAGEIVKVLFEADGKKVDKAEIQRKTRCGKISDAFRRPDGPQVWKRLIVVTRGRKGFYSLIPRAFNHSP